MEGVEANSDGQYVVVDDDRYTCRTVTAWCLRSSQDGKP